MNVYGNIDDIFNSLEILNWIYEYLKMKANGIFLGKKKNIVNLKNLKVGWIRKFIYLSFIGGAKPSQATPDHIESPHTFTQPHYKLCWVALR